MLRKGTWLPPALAILLILLVSIAATTATQAQVSSTPKGPGLSPYTLSSGPQVFARYGIKAGKQNSTSIPHIDPLLLRLAREGHAQNIRPLPDGTIRLLVDSTGADLLRGDSSVLVAVAHAGAVDRHLARPSQTVLSGTVTAVGGAGLSGATVSAMLGAEVVTTTTDSNGSYSLNVAGTGDYQVGVYLDGYEWQPSVLVAAPPGAGDVNFELVAANNTITGNVSAQSGPIAGAIVTAMDLAQDNFTAGDSTTTDALGNYTLTVSQSTYEVRAFAPPLGVKSRTVQVPPDAGNQDFQFEDQPLFSVSGVIRKANGQPLPYGEVTFASTSVAIDSCDAPYTQALTAGADGSYSVTLPSGTYSVYANWPGEWPDHWVIAVSTQLTVSGNVTGFDLIMPAVGTIRGTVRDPNGQPLANARVFSWRDDPNASPWFDGFFPTDDDGNYVVTATLGLHKLLAFSDVYVDSSTQTVNLTANTTGVDMQVQTGIQAGGQLTGSDAQPLRWATVRYLTGVQGAQFNRHATVYYDGRWNAVMSAGSYSINASQPGFEDQDRQVVIQPNPPDTNFTLVRKTLRLVGKANIVAGRGLCDTYMTATNTATGNSTTGNSTGDGDYALLVAPGTYNVWPYKYNSDSSSFNAQVTVPPVTSSIDFTITEIMFSDVQTNTYFFTPVAYLIYNGIASGYNDGTYRPFNNTTRGQLAKLIVNAEHWTIDTSGGPHFSDVPPDNPFYTYIETAYHHGVINGYNDGTFRWSNNVTRAQVAKIVVSSQGWPIDLHGGPHFSDVPPGNTFYNFVETAFNRGVLSGYNDGTFRPGNNATRGQIAKILYNALTGR